jgi:hypothetical protein
MEHLRRKARNKQSLSGPSIGTGEFPIEVPPAHILPPQHVQFLQLPLSLSFLVPCKPSIGFGRLPIEMVQSIFSHLETWILFQCREVCRLWRLVYLEVHQPRAGRCFRRRHIMVAKYFYFLEIRRVLTPASCSMATTLFTPANDVEPLLVT